MTPHHNLSPRLAEKHARERATLHALRDAIDRQFAVDRAIAARGLSAAHAAAPLTRIGEGRA